MNNLHDKSQNIFEIYDIICVIFEYVEFNSAYMLYNRAFSKLAKTREIALKIKSDSDIINIQNFKHYKHLFVYVCYVPNLSVHEFICSCENVIGLGVCLNNYVLSFGTTRPFNNIKKLHLTIEYHRKKYSFTRYFLSLEELSVKYSLPNSESVMLCDNPYDVNHFNMTIQYVKKILVSGYVNVTCCQSDVVESLSIHATRAIFNGLIYKNIKNLVINVKSLCDFRPSKTPALETLTINDCNLIPNNLIPINLSYFHHLKEINVINTLRSWDGAETDIIERLKKILVFKIPTFNFFISQSSSGNNNNLHEFCKDNNIRILYK